MAFTGAFSFFARFSSKSPSTQPTNPERPHIEKMAAPAVIVSASSAAFSPSPKSFVSLGGNFKISSFPTQRRRSSRKCNLYREIYSYTTKKTITKTLCCQLKVEEGIGDEACELVSGVDLILGEGTDSFRAYLLKAVKNNNGTGLLILSDIFGFADSATRDLAYRVACSGYNVLVPDLFHGDPWTSERSKDEFELWVTRQSPERLVKDITTSARWMVDEFLVAEISKKLGIIGFCFGGGRLIETLAGDSGLLFGTGVCFYGTRIDPSLARKINVPVLFVSGDDDPLCPVSVLHDMEKNIKNSKVLIYHGRGHGFAHRPESPEEDEDAEDAFAQMKAWLHDCLVALN
ncbi:hypothetical protein H6P81_015402 [Aristolochia fimbriata]|uniref:Carboxymethylenebutenolidase homolog n=1 Tax=Aristolochia fimbriata TaxID=158543 RepID=A0AAV7E8I1_ARIFI|nr:hypothetical protein H6P81_015402 [Aristolochia fimbriata]